MTMQIYAFNEKGRLLLASEALRHKNYICPECQNKVRLRGGRWRQLHFYHIGLSSPCSLSKKSLIHVHIQYALQKKLAPEKIWLEHPFHTINRIADVVWPAKKLIFEVQCSPITGKEIAERNRDYKQEGYQVVWILHDRYYNRFKLTSAESYLLCYPHYFCHAIDSQSCILYDQLARIERDKRVQRSPRFPIHVKQLTHLDTKQLLCQMPEERKNWELSFYGDLFHRSFSLPLKERVKQKNLWRRWMSMPFRLFFHFLLEKTQ